MTFCYCCSDTARQAVYLKQGWQAVCRYHATEAVTEEPGTAVCEIEELEALKNERPAKTA